MDEAARLLLAEMGGCGTADVEAALEMDTDDRIPIVLGHFVEDGITQNAGIVDHNVEAAKGIHGLVDHSLSGLEIGNATEICGRRASGTFDLLNNLVRRYIICT